MIAVAGLVASCSTSKLATRSTDDVYNSVAQAKEVEPYVPQNQVQNQSQAQNQEDYDEYYGTSNPYYDMDYSSRINRFYNGYSWQGYYDPYFDNYYYGNSYGPTNYLGYGNGWYNGYGLGGWGGGFGLGFGYGSIWNNPFYYGNFGYGWSNPWGWNSWGPNSYYDRYGWGGGWYGSGWGIGSGGVYTNKNYRPRPGCNNNGMPRTAAPANGNYGRPSRSGYAGNDNGRIGNTNPNASGRPSRSYQPQNNGRTTAPAERPTQMSRPSRTESAPPSYSPPPSNSRGSSGGGSTGGGGGSSRPSRAGRG